MSQAANRTVAPKYIRETHTADTPVPQRADVDLNEPIVHSEGIANIVGDQGDPAGYAAKLAFMEEPVTIRLEENSKSDFPETHAPCAVNGRGAEIFVNGSWISATWLPIGLDLTIKRKYVEVLARARTENIRTKHDEATVERPQNKVERRSTANYPMSVIEDRNPLGAAWLSRILRGL
jgi:hypothetical protein